ncbi:DUF6402 family protein [Stutzerimonas frequens]|uniref:DUF6402 family protein n=1 Tax=Stutzerimonas frequens TaxID=2968969 RepID=UPI002934D086|nr:DUF6402 family protein [Stutzerimonas frequens]WOC79731.1 DUF6402 family protein [Stutzerimonas frequens]
MLASTILSQLTPASQTTGTEVRINPFKITDIPAAMERLSWTQSARLMRKWFSNPPYELPKTVKMGDVAASTLKPEQLLTDLPFDWLFSASGRIKPIIDAQVENLAVVNEFNGTVGRQKAVLDQLSNGLIMLMTRIARLNLLDGPRGTLKDCYLDFSHYSAMQLEEASQFNFFKIGASTWEKASDELDDVYGALGSFAMKIAATKFRTVSNDRGFAAIGIDEIGLYVRDTYDFVNVGSDQLLGYWSDERVIRPGPIDYFAQPNFIDRGDRRHFKVTNNSFNDYRAKHGKGGDFLVFSTVKHYPVSIVVHLSSTDFAEYHSRAPRP